MLRTLSLTLLCLALSAAAPAADATPAAASTPAASAGGVSWLAILFFVLAFAAYISFKSRLPAHTVTTHTCAPLIDANKEAEIEARRLRIEENQP